MEKLLHRDNSLLGDTPRDPFGNPEAVHGTPRKKSDVDFNDVFGGPPRHSSIYDLRHSLGEPVDVYGRVGSGGDGWGEEASLQSRRPWASLGEKPVFGEFSSPSPRRKDLGQDFFNDIFRGGGDSVCSTPKKSDRDLFSTPGSRVLSPARPLPPKSEAFSGSSTLLSQLSLSRKLAKDQEHSSLFSSPERTPNKIEGTDLDAGTSKASMTNQLAQAQDDHKDNAHAPFRQSTLSCQFSHDQDGSLETVGSATAEIEGQFKEGSTGSKVNSRTGQFHFSIYKWASKGVMLVVPSNSKDRSTSESRFSGLPVPFLQGVDLPPDDKTMPTSVHSETEIQDNSVSTKLATGRRDVINSTENVAGMSAHKFESVPLPNDVTTEPDIGTNQKVQEEVHTAAQEMQKVQEEVPVTMQEMLMPFPKILCNSMNDNFRTEEREDNKWAEEKESILSNTTSRRSACSPVNIKRQGSRKVSVDQLDAQDASVALEDKIRGGRIKGRVKEFIKIFNKDISCKPIETVESHSRSSKAKDLGKSRLEEEVESCATKTDEGEKISHCTTMFDASVVIEQILKEEKIDSDVSSDGKKNCESSSWEREKASMLFFGSTPKGFDASHIHMEEEPHYEVEECLVEHIIQEPELPQTDLDWEEIQNSDAKICKWSAGKEGNIRSLLSTLQYVLWSGSGWKPVPLMDIIESSSVKSAYQKALLCLHPDKLQQRGAPMHQKYIAEKVFDILQEAWDHFNCLSTL